MGPMNAGLRGDIRKFNPIGSIDLRNNLGRRRSSQNRSGMRSRSQGRKAACRHQRYRYHDEIAELIEINKPSHGRRALSGCKRSSMFRAGS